MRLAFVLWLNVELQAMPDGFATVCPGRLAGCDLVLETIAEKRPAKQLLYGQLAPQLADGGILATNTSSIPITRLASGLAARRVSADCISAIQFAGPWWRSSLGRQRVQTRWPPWSLTPCIWGSSRWWSATGRASS